MRSTHSYSESDLLLQSNLCRSKDRRRDALAPTNRDGTAISNGLHSQFQRSIAMITCSIISKLEDFAKGLIQRESM